MGVVKALIGLALAHLIMIIMGYHVSDISPDMLFLGTCIVMAAGVVTRYSDKTVRVREE